ncbi:MAG TPA: hypothetical protein VNG90_03880 [Candidatus Acidoferrum sp.]|nr:hypothetical protein [Candidatus Acidoferrum sp.]
MPTEESNTSITEAQALAIAARVNGAQQLVAGIYKVARLDRSEAYYIVASGQQGGQGNLVAVDAAAGAVMGSATTKLLDTSWLATEPPYQPGARLVWAPCQISLSPLYPFWQVGSSATQYVDHRGKIWHQLLPAGPG